MTSDLFEKFRNDFPALKAIMHGQPLAFLDSAASAQKPAVVIETMADAMRQGYANIHRGLYEHSQNMTRSYEEARVKAGRFIGAGRAEEIIFTRNSTEAINLVGQSWGSKFLSKGDEIVLTQMEHHANIVPWQLLRDRIGFTIRVLPVTDDGALQLDQLNGLLNENTKLVSFVHVSNALGTINPAAEIVRRVKAYNENIKILVDGSQAAVHMPVDIQAIGCDFYAYTGHKVYGPTGIGVLYGKQEILQEMPPFQGGGDIIDTVTFEKTNYKNPPQRFEAGTQAIIEAIGLGAAIDYLQTIGIREIQRHEHDLLKYGTEALESIKGLNIYGKTPDKASILSFNIDGIHPGDIAMVLDQCGVAVRSGHHCCMPLMHRLGVDATVRASMALYSSKSDIDRLVESLHKAIKLFS